MKKIDNIFSFFTIRNKQTIPLQHSNMSFVYDNRYILNENETYHICIFKGLTDDTYKFKIVHPTTDEVYNYSSISFSKTGINRVVKFTEDDLYSVEIIPV